MGEGIVACMATFPGRLDTIERAAESIVDQVDELRIHVNDPLNFNDPLSIDDHPKIVWSSGYEEDLGDTGKVANLPESGYVFLVDDDIIYPPNYVSTLKLKLQIENNRAVVGCHAAIMKQPINNYFKDRQVIHFISHVPYHVPVNVLGTGCLAYHTDYVDFELSDAPSINMLDVHFAVWCQKNKKRMISVARPARWLTPIQVQDSLWSNRGAGEEQTRYMNSVATWKVH